MYWESLDLVGGDLGIVVEEGERFWGDNGCILGWYWLVGGREDRIKVMVE